MTHRESGADLVRCVGLLFVVSVHSFLYNGFYSAPQTGVLMWTADSARWLFFCCNGLFMTLTGYLRSGRPFRGYRHLLPILTGYALTCGVSFPIFHFFLGEPASLIDWLDKFVNFGNYAWYVEMYIGLFLLSPFLNLLLERLSTRRQYLWLLGTLLFLTALPSLTSISLAPDYWTGLYPLTYYVLGAGVRRFRPKIPAWVSLCLAGLTAMGLGAVSVLSTDKGFSTVFTQGYGGFWTTLVTLFVFLGLIQIRCKGLFAKILAFMAGGCFEGYILSRLLDIWTYSSFPQWNTPKNYILSFLCITLPTFFLSCLAGKALNTLAHRICGHSRLTMAK